MVVARGSGVGVTIKNKTYDAAEFVITSALTTAAEEKWTKYAAANFEYVLRPSALNLLMDATPLDRDAAGIVASYLPPSLVVDAIAPRIMFVYTGNSHLQYESLLIRSATLMEHVKWDGAGRTLHYTILSVVAAHLNSHYQFHRQRVDDGAGMSNIIASDMSIAIERDECQPPVQRWMRSNRQIREYDIGVITGLWIKGADRRLHPLLCRCHNGVETVLRPADWYVKTSSFDRLGGILRLIVSEDGRNVHIVII